jgi:hypothetical protein
MNPDKSLLEEKRMKKGILILSVTLVTLFGTESNVSPSTANTSNNDFGGFGEIINSKPLDRYVAYCFTKHETKVWTSPCYATTEQASKAIAFHEKTFEHSATYKVVDASECP